MEGTHAHGRLSSGTMLDHYQVDRLIGAGGMGDVYLARDTRLNRRVALKLIRPEALGDDVDVAARFVAEARTTARFNHPHIVTVHYVGEHAGLPFLVFELIDGDTLRDRLEERPPDLDETLRITRDIAGALREAHRHGILHRDLKPKNVMLDRDDRLRVLDFGLSRRLPPDHPALADRDTLPRESSLDLPTIPPEPDLQGSPLYIAPEVWKRQQPTPAVDIWALGLILFELVAGRPAYDDTSFFGLTALVTTDGSAPPLPPDTPATPRLAALVARCLEKDPARRPTAQAAWTELDAHIRTATEHRRGRVGVYIAAAALLLLVGAAVALTWGGEPPAAEPVNSARDARVATGQPDAGAPVTEPDGVAAAETTAAPEPAADTAASAHDAQAPAAETTPPVDGAPPAAAEKPDPPRVLAVKVVSVTPGATIKRGRRVLGQGSAWVRWRADRQPPTVTVAREGFFSKEVDLHEEQAGQRIEVRLRPNYGVER